MDCHLSPSLNESELPFMPYLHPEEEEAGVNKQTKDDQMRFEEGRSKKKLFKKEHVLDERNDAMLLVKLRVEFRHLRQCS